MPPLSVESAGIVTSACGRRGAARRVSSVAAHRSLEAKEQLDAQALERFSMTAAGRVYRVEARPSWSSYLADRRFEATRNRPAGDRSARQDPSRSTRPAKSFLSRYPVRLSRSGVSGCGVSRWFRSLRGRPALSGCAAWWPATRWLMGRSAGDDSGRSVFCGAPPRGTGLVALFGSWSEAFGSSDGGAAAAIGRSPQAMGASASGPRSRRM